MKIAYIKKKIKSKKAFALSELLFSIVIVSLAGLLISEGVVLCSNFFLESSELAMANVLIDEYETAIKSTLSNSEFLMNYNDKPLFKNKKLNMNGYIDSDDGAIVFVPVKIDYYGNILSANKKTNFIPKRNMYGNNVQNIAGDEKITYKSNINYKYIKNDGIGNYEVTISVMKDDKEISSRTFEVYEIGEII